MVFWIAACALGAAWLLILGTPYENTLWLAAIGKVDLGLSFFYRFRDSGIAVDGSWGGVGTKAFLALCSLVGIRLVWGMTIVAQALLLRHKSVWIQTASLTLLAAALLWGEALLVWNLVFTLLVTLAGRLAAPRGRLALVATLGVLAVFLGSVELAWILGNPARMLTRQRALGGKSYQDTLKPHSRQATIELRNDCVAVLNPDDLRGVQSVELLSRASLAGFAEIVLLDLKVVEANYRYLSLKDEKGEFLFSDAARSFAEKEQDYAASQRARLESVANVCLLAPFDRLPDQETLPFSRARKILDARKKAGLPTQIIQLPAAEMR